MTTTRRSRREIAGRPKARLGWEARSRRPGDKRRDRASRACSSPGSGTAPIYERARSEGGGQQRGPLTVQTMGWLLNGSLLRRGPMARGGGASRFDTLRNIAPLYRDELRKRPRLAWRSTRLRHQPIRPNKPRREHNETRPASRKLSVIRDTFHCGCSQAIRYPITNM